MTAPVAVGAFDVPLGLAVLMTLGAVLYLVLGTIGIRRLWRRESPIWDSKPAWFLYGHATFCGYVRAMYPLVAAGLLLALTAALLNRPKRIVPPHLRDQPGMLAEWAGNARARRAARMPDEPPPRRSA